MKKMFIPIILTVLLGMSVVNAVTLLRKKLTCLLIKGNR